MKYKIFLFVFVFFINFLLFSGGNKEYTGAEVPENYSFASLRDGTYEGFCKNGLVEVELEVKINNGVVSKINIIKHKELFGGKAEKITEDIIDKQSLEVDTVSGATYSSAAILNAVYNAINNNFY